MTSSVALLGVIAAPSQLRSFHPNQYVNAVLILNKNNNMNTDSTCETDTLRITKHAIYKTKPKSYVRGKRRSTVQMRMDQIKAGTAFCDCTRPAVVVKGNAFICQRCLDIDEPGHEHRTITPRKHKTITAKYHGATTL